MQRQLVEKDPDAEAPKTEDRRGRQRMRWLDSIRLKGHEFEQTLRESEGQGSLRAAVHGASKSWTQLGN